MRSSIDSSSDLWNKGIPGKKWPSPKWWPAGWCCWKQSMKETLADWCWSRSNMEKSSDSHHRSDYHFPQGHCWRGVPEHNKQTKSSRIIGGNTFLSFLSWVLIRMDQGIFFSLLKFSFDLLILGSSTKRDKRHPAKYQSEPCFRAKWPDKLAKLRIWETHVLTVMKMIDIAIRATCPVWFRLEGTLEDVTEVDWDQIRKSGHIVWSGHPEWWGFVLENVECIYMGFFKAPSWI